jgi:hypothetical protein
LIVWFGAKIIFSKHNFEVKVLLSTFEKRLLGQVKVVVLLTLHSPFIEMNDIMFRKHFMVEHYPSCGLGILLMWA